MFQQLLEYEEDKKDLNRINDEDKQRIIKKLHCGQNSKNESMQRKQRFMDILLITP